VTTDSLPVRSVVLDDSVDDVVGRRCVWVVCFLFPAMAVLGMLHARAPLAKGEPPAAVNTIDPNTAPWWELTALAFEVVRYRESVRAAAPGSGDDRVFDAPLDLVHVRGIGPKTVERIAPHLRFSSR